MKEELVKSIFFEKGNIADRKELDKRNIDTIVNAANPTLMGSTQGVDGAIHKSINRIFRKKGKDNRFKDMICKELKTGKEANIIRCQRGEAVATSGYGLCDYVIHVVGAKYDGDCGRFHDCSSSVVHILESCYYSIVKIIKEHPDIKNIAIPIISSGEYKIPFHTAAEIAIASIYNAILEWKLHDPEVFEMSGLEKIYFFVYDNEQNEVEKQLQDGRNILKKYIPIMTEEKKIVFQSSIRAHFRYWKEIADYDKTRGYFSIAKWVREFLMVICLFFLPVMLLKDLYGGRNWEKRRQFVEWFAAVKILIPVIFYILVKYKVMVDNSTMEDVVFPIIVIYNISDTVTYLLSLIILADIQRPSANIIRSMIMLFVNYIEVSLGMSFLYFIYHGKTFMFFEMVSNGIFGMEEETVMNSSWDYIFSFVDSGIKFFFITLVFGYFANHMHQRKFRS